MRGRDFLRRVPGDTAWRELLERLVVSVHRPRVSVAKILVYDHSCAPVRAGSLRIGGAHPPIFSGIPLSFPQVRPLDEHNRRLLANAHPPVN
jgi:hypothetical protein